MIADVPPPSTHSRVRQFGVRFRWTVVGLLAILNIWGLSVYRQETSQLAQLSHSLVEGVPDQESQVEQLVSWVCHKTATTRPNVSFLMPVFAPLRPTAWQVAQHGGDCSYKARLFIVLARHLDIPARKVALFQPDGESTHAVAVAETDSGEMVCDLLFGTIYRHENGALVRLEELKGNTELLQECLAREAAQGNRLAAKYPVNKYSYFDPKTINWSKLPGGQWLHAGLARLLGPTAADTLPLPYLMNEPALIVFSASMAVVGLLLFPKFGLGKRNSTPVTEPVTTALKPSSMA